MAAPESIPSATNRSPRPAIYAFLALTKPRIVELLLVTTLPAMMVAAGGWPGTGLVVSTLIGGALSAAGANALNCYLDRDIDRIMSRTSRRPLPSAEIPPPSAARFGVMLGIFGFLWLAVLVNLLAATLATAALLFYVLVYTGWLKRRTDQNIVIGGAAGAVPVLVGWAAAAGTLAMPAWVLFMVVFYWTPAHFWALALRYRHQYAAAGVPMLPVLKGSAATTGNIVAYSGLTVVSSLLLVPVAGMGILYQIAAPALGAWLMAEAWSVHSRPERAIVLFVRSTYYLALLFGTVAADTLVAL